MKQERERERLDQNVWLFYKCYLNVVMVIFMYQKYIQPNLFFHCFADSQSNTYNKKDRTNREF